MIEKRPVAVVWRILLICIVCILSVRAVFLALNQLEKDSSGLERLIGADSLSLDTLRAELTSIHPSTDSTAIPSVSDAVLSINRRLRDIITVGRARGQDYRFVFQGGYGSGFLRINRVGNDLDYSLKIHLGVFDIMGKGDDEIAGAILTRIEKFLGTYLEVMIFDRGSDLYPEWFSNISKGRLRSRGFLEKHLAESIGRLWQNRRNCMVFESRAGILVPAEVPPGTLTLWTHLMPSSLSNLVRYTDNMFPGIREVSVSMAFFVDLEDRSSSGSGRNRKDVPLVCLHPYSGKEIGLENYFIFIAPEKEYSAGYLRSLVAGDPESWASNRIMAAGELLSDMEFRISTGVPLKALKRLHQAYDFLLPVFDKPFREQIEAFLAEHLTDPEVLLNEEIRVLSSGAADALSTRGSADTYLKSGDLLLTLMRVLEDLMKISDDSSGVSSAEARELRLRLLEKMISFHSPNNWITRNGLKEILEEIAGEAERWTASCLENSEDQMLLYRSRIAAELIACGIRPIPVYCISEDGELGVLRDDIEELATLEQLNASASRPGFCQWRYQIIGPDQIPPDRDGSIDYYPCVRWLQLSLSDVEEARYREVLSLLKAYLHWFLEEEASEAANN